MIALQKQTWGREHIAVYEYCIKNNIYVEITNTPREGWMRVGSVEFVESVLGPIKPDTFPQFCSNHIHRNWRYSDTLPKEKAFIKPADRYKRFSGYVYTPGEEEKYHAPYIIQDVVEFVEEYRYYITRGRVVAKEWYQSQEGEPPTIPQAPPLPIDIPEEWCGTLDMGYTQEGDFILVEAHHPYACGWYGEKEDNSIYAKWLIAGWNYMLEKNKG